MSTLREHLQKLDYTVTKNGIELPSRREREKAYARIEGYFTALGYTNCRTSEGYTFMHFANDIGNGFSLFTHGGFIAIDCFERRGDSSYYYNIDWDIDKVKETLND